jgi:hypothetical protein
MPRMAETRLQTQASLGVQLLGPDLRRLLGRACDVMPFTRLHRLNRL